VTDASYTSKLAPHVTGEAVVRRELWGFLVWGLMGLVIAVPELWAAFSDQSRWPTISGTVGYLEYWHPWVSLVVVGLIVWGASSAIRFPPKTTEELGKELKAGQTDQKVLPGGRITRTEDPKPPVRAMIYFPLALGVVLLGTFLSYATRPDDKYRLGEVLYTLIAIFWVGIPSVMAYWYGKDVPYPTLFATFRDLANRVRILAVALAALLTILLIHLVLYPWPTVITDLQDLHKQYEKQRHEQKKQSEPSPFTP
jgi:hypothetical protein